MLRPRVIACLLLSDGGLVKTRRFKNATYIGDPHNAIRIFNEKEADELIVIDISATKKDRGPDFALIEQFASECFMPVTYGGGIHSLTAASQLFSLGIEKVCMQSAAFQSPQLMTDVAARYGSQAVVSAVDVKGGDRGRPKLRWDKRWNYHGDWLSWTKKSQELGAGEILLTDVDREGTLAGVNLDLISAASSSVEIPVIANGGIGSKQDIKLALGAGASAVAAGSLFVFYGPHRAVLITYLDQDDFAYLGAES